MPNTPTTRILDASANRAAEGLRVVEDYVRFVLDDLHLTQLMKQLRHDFTQACAALPHAERCAARDTQHDVGTKISTDAESQRTNAWEVCQASFERTKQSLRSLEEFSKVASPELASQFEAQRYRLYTLEKAIGITRNCRSRLSNTNLCVLIDGMKSVAEFAATVQQLVDAGVGMIQLRDDQLTDRQLVERAKMLVATAPLAIVNNRPDNRRRCQRRRGSPGAGRPQRQSCPHPARPTQADRRVDALDRASPPYGARWGKLSRCRADVSPQRPNRSTNSPASITCEKSPLRSACPPLRLAGFKPKTCRKCWKRGRHVSQ